MKISEFLEQLRGYVDYVAYLATEPPNAPGEHRGGEQLSKFDYILGVFGPTPAFWPRGEGSCILSPLQLVTIGWDDAHEFGKWNIRPTQEQICETLGLSVVAYDKIRSAEDLIPARLGGYNVQLRADLIAACGLPEETGTPFFSRTKTD